MDLDKLKYYVSERLENLSGIKVYNLDADDNPTFPYLVYKFMSSSEFVRNRMDWILEIDYWNNTHDDAEILEAMNKVKNGVYDEAGELLVPGLDYSYQSEDEGFYHCYEEFQAEIPVEESNMSRLNQRFVLKVR